MTLEDVQRIETIIRQAWCSDGDKFETWLGVDQDQALALLAMIPGRLPAHPQVLPAFRTQAEGISQQDGENRKPKVPDIERPA